MYDFVDIIDSSTPPAASINLVRTSNVSTQWRKQLDEDHIFLGRFGWGFGAKETYTPIEADIDKNITCSVTLGRPKVVTIFNVRAKSFDWTLDLY